MTAAERERAYSPSSCIGGSYRPFLAAYAERSRAARDACSYVTHRYGEDAAQLLDLYLPPPAAAPPPLLAFFHGGYWQELSRRDSAFAALDCVRHGIAFAAVGYGLAPATRLPRIIAQAVAAVDWLGGQAPALGIDPARICVAGSSAGAHLAAMACLGSTVRVHAAILVSGIYDLAPLVGTSINAALALDDSSAAVLSPLAGDLVRFPPSLVCWGEVETAAFRAQSQDFAAALRRAGAATAVMELPARNHFDVVLDLADPATLLGATVLPLLR